LQCELAVVGAGWGGVYAAWRLAIDTKTIPARGVCVFEANGRVGGRVFSVRDLPHFGELTIDVGGECRQPNRPCHTARPPSTG
jgi:protoporphyrinogen oxidase